MYTKQEVSIGINFQKISIECVKDKSSAWKGDSDNQVMQQSYALNHRAQASLTQVLEHLKYIPQAK